MRRRILVGLMLSTAFSASLIGCGERFRRDGAHTAPVVNEAEAGPILVPVAPLDLDAGHEPSNGPEDVQPTEADLDESSGPPRVVFVPAKFNYEELGTGPFSEGPQWEFRTVRLPAISKDGRSVIVYERETAIFQQIPNLELVRRLVLNSKPIEKISMILSSNEFLDARDKGMDAGTPERAKRVFNELQAVVRARIQTANERLRDEALRPLERCKTDDRNWFERDRDGKGPDPYEPEYIDCPGAKIVYHPKGPKFDVNFEGRKFTVSRHDWAVPRPIMNGTTVSVALRVSLSGAIDHEKGLLVFLLEPTCLHTGDWCYMDSVWHILPLRQASRK